MANTINPATSLHVNQKNLTAQNMVYVPGSNGGVSIGVGTGNAYADAAQKDFDFCNYANTKYEQKSEEAFGLLVTMTPDQKARMKDIDGEIKAEVGKLNLPEDKAQEEIQLKRFKRMGEEFKGTELGAKCRETYALGSYSRDAFNYTSQRYGMPQPGQTPYTSGAADPGAVKDPAMRKEMSKQETFQVLCLMGSLFCPASMGLFSMMAAGWLYK